MEQITKPNIKLLAAGRNLTAKQMQANAGELLPEHLADMESILFVEDGECILTIKGEENTLKKGDAFVVPPAIKHQIKAITDFKGIHFMPIKIKFEFFNEVK